ncbi:hypothetical protein GGR54DRAFT_135615 [Hypoxylon sp. NC1633]|nr:hypothetical protein GGR54DRAFT_135615 [Hypoxylon sp. NC1633]
MADKQPITLNNPQGTLSVVFSEATFSPEARVRCSKLAWTAFGGPLTLEEYLERELYLGELPLARGTGWRFWCLTPADDRSHMLAMCKTLHRDLLVRGPDPTPCAEMSIRQEQGYCVCSVVTDAAYRGRGLASVLLRNVAAWLDGPGDATASILYSEVGDFYVSKGWHTLDAFQSTLTVPLTPSSSPIPSSSPPPAKHPPQLPATRLLSGAEIPSLCDRDTARMRQDFATYPLAPNTVLAAVLPTSAMVCWLQSRADYTNARTAPPLPKRKPAPTPTARGSICAAADAWVYWLHDLWRGRLIVQRVRPAAASHKILASDSDSDSDSDSNSKYTSSTLALARLLLDALEEAARWSLPKVVLWNPGPELCAAMEFLEAEMGVRIMHEKRESAEIPCLRWRGGEKRRVAVWPHEYYPWS